MEHVWLRNAVFVLAYILESGRSSVEPVGDYHIVLYQQATHFAALAI